MSLDDQLPPDHPVRAVWDFVCRLDLAAFHRPARAVVGHAGAPVIPAQLLFALWLFAIIDGTVSARRLSELCQRDLPFQWLCGADPVNYHTLSDFYSAHEPALRELFVEHVAALRQQELIVLHTVTLDGHKVPANASKDGARRATTLQTHLEEARTHRRRLEATRDQEAALGSRRAAARRRGASSAWSGLWRSCSAGSNSAATANAPAPSRRTPAPRRPTRTPPR